MKSCGGEKASPDTVLIRHSNLDLLIFREGEKQVKTISLSKRYVIAVIALAGAALACSAPAAGQGTPGTGVAQAFTSTPFVVTATPEAGGITATAPTSGGSTSSGGSGGSSGGASCNYDSQYVTDVAIPDGTKETTGAGFTKTWRVKNNGCKEWPGGTTLVFVSGDSMGGPASVPVPQTAVGGTQDISLNLTAPGAAGNAEGYWQLRSPDGIQFGDQLSVKIKVKAPAPAATNTPVPPSGPTATFHFIPLVPVVPISPLLIANFTATYAGASPCLIGTAYWVKVSNTGASDFTSSHIKFEAPAGTVRNEATVNGTFASAMNCSATTSTRVVPGSSAYLIGGENISWHLGGTSAKITVTLCTASNAGGTCVDRTVTFTVP